MSSRAEAHFERGIKLRDRNRLEEALVEYRAAAARGHGGAMNEIGLAYKRGQGVAKNVAEAIEWYKRAAAAGNVVGMHNLAVNLRDGVPEAGIAPDRAEAMRLMRQAAEGGHMNAVCALGVWLSQDNKDDPEQVVWYRLAIENGSKEAMNSLGLCYENGRGGLEKNAVIANSWYLKAAELGDANAMANLGVNYEDGLGVEKDLATAAEWFERASKAGDAGAAADLERVKKLIANEAAKKKADEERKTDEERARLRAQLEVEERLLEARRARLRKEADELAAEQARLAAEKRAPETDELVRLREENARLKRENAARPIAEDDLLDVQEIGQGAFGPVYKATYRPVVVKLVTNGAGSHADIVNEVAVLQKVTPHRHVLSCRGFTIFKGQPALVVEYCAGESLSKALEGASDAVWPLVRQMGVARDVASGVAHLHKNKIVHRDLAARSVWLTGESVARVTDFGVSIKSEALDASAVAWMAPEQLVEGAAGQHTFTTQSNVYSFGVVLYELFERRAPWSECSSRAEIVAKLQAGEALPIDEDKYPESVLSVVELCRLEAAKRPDMETVAGLLGKAHDRVAKKSSQRTAASHADDDAPPAVSRAEKEPV